MPCIDFLGESGSGQFVELMDYRWCRTRLYVFNPDEASERTPHPISQSHTHFFRSNLRYNFVFQPVIQNTLTERMVRNEYRSYFLYGAEC